MNAYNVELEYRIWKSTALSASTRDLLKLGVEPSPGITSKPMALLLALKSCYRNVAAMCTLI